MRLNDTLVQLASVSSQIGILLVFISKPNRCHLKQLPPGFLVMLDKNLFKCEIVEMPRRNKEMRDSRPISYALAMVNRNVPTI